MKRRLLLAFTVALGCAGPAAGTGPASIDDKVGALFTPWSNKASPGCAVAVAKNDVTIFQRAYGQADLEHGSANLIDTRFEAGSVTKQFTATAVLLLVQDKKIGLSDDVRKYLPEVPDYGRVITIENLLNHTSGLRDWGSIQMAAAWPRTSRYYNMDDVLDIVSRQRGLNYEPGSAFSYTNSGYNLLAMIVHRVARQTIAEFTKARIFRPLGMTATSWRDDYRQVVLGRAIAYSVSRSGYRQNMPFEDAYGNGGLITTVGDLTRWNIALDNSSLGSFVTAALQRPGTVNNGRSIEYGRGLFVTSYRGFAEVSHPGGTAGYVSWLGRYPQQRLSVALLCNASNVHNVQVAHQIADLFLPASPAGATPAQSSNLADYAGTFLNRQDGGVMVLERDGEELRTSLGESLRVSGATVFAADLGDFTFTDPDHFVFAPASGGAQTDYRRIAAFSPTPAELATYLGRYRSEEADATYSVKLVDGRLVVQIERRPGHNFQLTPLTPEVFRASIDGVPAIVRFQRGTSDGLPALRLSIPRVSDLRFERMQ